MSAVEGLPGGTTLEDSVALAKRLVADGIDALHVSVGLRETNFMVSPPACVEKGWNAPLSRAVRDGIEAAVPVIVAGRVADEQTAQGIIDRGDADMVAMGRALIADPFLPAKVAVGEAGDIIRCVGCNEGCVAGSARGTGVGCALNPLSGAEGKYDLDPVASPEESRGHRRRPRRDAGRPCRPVPGIRWICMKNRIASAVCSTWLASLRTKKIWAMSRAGSSDS